MDDDVLRKLTRAQIQKLARREKIKANGKTDNIIQSLLEKYPDGVPSMPELASREEGMKERPRTRRVILKLPPRKVRVTIDVMVKEEPEETQGPESVEGDMQEETREQSVRSIPPHTPVPLPVANATPVRGQDPSSGHASAKDTTSPTHITPVRERAPSQVHSNQDNERLPTPEPSEPTGLRRTDVRRMLRTCAKVIFDETAIQRGITDCKTLQSTAEALLEKAEKDFADIEWLRICLEEDYVGKWKSDKTLWDGTRKEEDKAKQKKRKREDAEDVVDDNDKSESGDVDMGEEDHEKEPLKQSDTRNPSGRKTRQAGDEEDRGAPRKRARTRT